MSRSTDDTPAAPTYPPIAEALSRWRRADEAWARARSPHERGAAMLQQLQARGEVHGLAEIEAAIEDRPRRALRGLLVEEGIWSAGEAIERLAILPFDERGWSLLALVPALEDRWLGRALEMASHPGWGDDGRWEANEELLAALAARASGGEQRRGSPESEYESGETTPSEAIQGDSGTLEHLLLSCRAPGAAGEGVWLGRSLQAAIDYVENDLLPQHAAELARRRDVPLFADFRRALFASGRELWDKPWFRAAFDAAERRGHLQGAAQERESIRAIAEDRFEGLLQIARRLEGEPRALVLSWAGAEREKRSAWQMAVDLARVAALAEGAQREAMIARIEPELEKLDTEDRLAIIVTLLPGARPADAVSPARRGLQSIASGEAKIQSVLALLASISDHVWSQLDRTDWEPALRAGSSRPDGWADHLRWTPYDVEILVAPRLPSEVREIVEERGLPALLGADGDPRLRKGARAIHALSSEGRARLAASLLSLSVITWRENSSAIGPIARALGDDELEHLSRLLREPDPKGGWSAELGLAEAWAARGRLERALEIVERISDDGERANARLSLTLAAGDARALPREIDPHALYSALDQGPNGLAPWTHREGESAFADALAERLDDESSSALRLHIWAALWPALTACMRDSLAPRVERAVEAVLAADNLEDDSLCAIAEHLPERLLLRIWSVRATAAAYRHTLAMFEHRFSEFMLAGEHHHGSTLHFLQRLGGDEALIEHAKWVAGVSR